nr:hypothetical protein CFP56_26524 [Quercus suber]
MARKGKRKGKGISESQDSQLQETQSTRPSFDHNEVSEQELSQILRPSSEPQTDEEAHQASNSIIIGTNAGKKRGRGKAKGINAKDGQIEAEIYDGKRQVRQIRKTKISLKFSPLQYLETGSEPSPIDCFKKFHTKKDGKEWATDHAKTLYEKMDAIKAKVVSGGTKTNDYQIFHEMVGEPSHGRVFGMGIGCSKHCKEDFTKEKEDLEARLREEMDSKLAKVVEKLEEKFAQKLQSMGIPQQSNIDPTTKDGTSRDEDDNSNNNIEVENNLEGDSKED